MYGLGTGFHQGARRSIFGPLTGLQEVAMKRLTGFLLVLYFAFLHGTGCATVGRDAQVKCPKCGAIFSVDEGLEGVHIGLPKP